MHLELNCRMQLTRRATKILSFFCYGLVHSSLAKLHLDPWVLMGQLRVMSMLQYVFCKSCVLFLAHLILKCNINTPQVLLTYKKWIIPLCGGHPLHWVLTWINFKKRELAIYDSYPELASYSWATPVCYHLPIQSLD